MNARFRTPVNALLSGAVISILFVLLVYYTPSKNVHIWFVTYPANVNALYALISFAVSGIYLSFLLTVIGVIIARSRGWVPGATFHLGRGGGPGGSAGRTLPAPCPPTRVAELHLISWPIRAREAAVPA